MEQFLLHNGKIVIRSGKFSDIEGLKCFFIKAYGEKTIFRSEQFLNYYFDASINKKDAFSNSIVAISNDGEIVAHYGGLEYNLMMNQKEKSIIWGVNAFTCQNYRGQGINSNILKIIIKKNKINGVIGFTQQTAFFYKKIGYNVFDFKKFDRYVFVLNYLKTIEVSKYINQIPVKLSGFKLQKDVKQNKINLEKIIKITEENIQSYDLKIDQDFYGLTTTHRTKSFLMWRLLKNPFVKYSVYGLVESNSIIAYIALREELLNPLKYKVNRIIDLFGEKKAVKLLLEKTINESSHRENIYIDFSMFGTLYEMELKALGFEKLENEDCCILPQVTNPIENRPNYEFLGIMSIPFSDDVKKMTFENVYFTRIDSDRDRLANIDQINLI